MDRLILSFIDEVKSDVASRVYSDGEGSSFEDKFTEYCLEVLESIGKSEGSRVLSYVHPNTSGGVDWKVNGYCLKDLSKDENNKEYFETLDLFITYYRNDSYDYNISKDDYLKTINQAKRFINAAFKRHIDYLDPSNSELNQLVKIIGTQGAEFDRLNVFILINGFSNHEKESIELSGLEAFVHTWDMSRFFKVRESNAIHEPIEIEVQKFTEDGKGLNCLKAPNINEIYDCYLAIVPGEFLSKLYKEYSSELLESNVRAFLGQAGKFNKGIRDTIRGNPQMFLPYNNGITATAKSVETTLLNNQLVITRMYDFQIVNGGQTTASLYHTKKKYKEVDLSKIFVQMKLTVIRDEEKKRIEVPNISRFANSQNKVSELDLSSNNQYFIQIEALSRKKYVINPDNRNQTLLWYFERANGQYRETLNKLTPSQQKRFKEQNPTALKFVKSDVAKFINVWELEPHYVAQGSQKNFIHYLKKISDAVEKKKLPKENFYRKLIANAILCKTADKLFGRKNVDAIGDTNLKAFTVAYTVSYLHYLTQRRLDLWKIYLEQRTDDFFNVQLYKLQVYVYNYLITGASGSLISEYAKRASTWEGLKTSNYSENLILILANYLISEKEYLERENEKEVDSGGVEDALFTISKIRELNIRFWDGFKDFVQKSKPEGFVWSEGFAWSDAFDLLSSLRKGKNLTERQISYGKRVLEYLEDKPAMIEEMRGLSKLVDSDFVDVKSVYDRLLLLNNDEWKRILDVAIQTKIWDTNEVSNVKSVQASLKRKERLKEQALIKAYESVKKLGKFGIKL